MALISLDELMGRSFHIPSYQRGYRWTEVEVEALLNDLWEFTKRKPNNNEFYCLQPIVLRKNLESEKEILLDGQQRLTTLYLILSFLDTKRKEENYSKELFTLNYETRKGSEEYLKRGGFREMNDEAQSNIDYYHLAKAYQCIENWFTKSPAYPGAKIKLIPILLDKSGEGANVRLIEYELQDNSKPIEVFLRLNQGKIPLTDAELVKALLLQADRYQEADLIQIQPKLDLIASEWYEIEKYLAQPDHWAFIAPQKTYKSDIRIGLLLELVAKQLDLESVSVEDILKNRVHYKHPCYFIFTLWLEEQQSHGRSRIDSIRELWEHIMGVYQHIEEWYTSHTLYHYIGYITSLSYKDLNGLIALAEGNGRVDFEQKLKQIIGKTLTKEPSCLSYDENKSEVSKLLLLHNVHLSIQSRFEQGRFPFSQYRDDTNGTWSLEHIFPQNPEPPNTNETCQAWIEEYIPSMEHRGAKEIANDLQSMQQSIDKLNPKAKLDDERAKAFGDLFTRIHTLESKEAPKKIHGLGNLCLLNTDMNSSLNNSGFDVKRNIIRKLSQQHYIPLATRQVFLKSFSAFPKTNYLWGEEDANDYFKSIENTYNFFKDITPTTDEYGRD